MRRFLFASDFVIPAESSWGKDPTGEIDELMLKEFSVDLPNHHGFFANIEAPFVARAEIEGPSKNGPRLCQAPHAIEVLKLLKVDNALLANNHIGDFGHLGIQETLRVLKSADIDHIGAGADGLEAKAPRVISLPEGLYKKQIKVFNYGEEEFGQLTAESPIGYNPISYLQAIIDSKEHMVGSESNYTVAVVHGGSEFYKGPSPSLRAFCHSLVELGFDLILCQHTHVYGMAETYREKKIIYGQGNFIFPKTSLMAKHQGWQKGLIAAIAIGDDNVAVELIWTNFDTQGVRAGPCMSFEDAVCNNEITLIDDQNFYPLWKEWCLASLRGYANVFFNLGILTRIKNKLLGGPQLSVFLKKLKLVNYIRTSSHADVIKTLADIALKPGEKDK